MNKKYKLAILIYGNADSGRDALTEEKYRDLATELIKSGFDVKSVLYNDSLADELAKVLPGFDVILVWVNPVEQGSDRKKLDALLSDVAASGSIVSTHPDVIDKIGTKEILYKSRTMDWGGDVELYSSFDDFQKRFPETLASHGVRILKKCRGNGGNGVYKIALLDPGNEVMVTHAIEAKNPKVLPLSHLLNEFRIYFDSNGIVIDQEWNKHTLNGMVRCYVSGTKVAGFGYQEVNALYELNDNPQISFTPASKRYYFTENCGFFSDLGEIMESKWIPELQIKQSIAEERMPVIWDADFFINNTTSDTIASKYTLCEINVSSVSPFPPSAIKFIVEEVKSRLNQ